MRDRAVEQALQRSRALYEALVENPTYGVCQVDGEGRLIAHPDISRVLRNTDLSALPQVAAARDPAGAGIEPSAITRISDGPAIMSMPTLPNTWRLAAAT